MSDFVLTGQPCPHCGGSDPAALNSDGWWTCFNGDCEQRWFGGEDALENVEVTPKSKDAEQISTMTAALLAGAEPAGIVEKGITQATVSRYGVAITGAGKRIYPYYLPEDTTAPAAAKKRVPTGESKIFPSEGPMSDCLMFGEWLYPKGGRFLTITEGEDDAMAASQMMGDKPAISVRNSATALADCKRRYEYIDSFDTIVLSFDSDAAGQKAAKKIAELFAGKVKVMRHQPGYKDASEYCAAGAEKKFVDDFWRAETHTPDGIVAGDALWGLVNEPLEKAAVMYPWDGLNDLLYGIRYAELVTVTSGSGMGKSQLLREMQWHMLSNCNENIGSSMLEENPRKSGLGIMSVAGNKPFHLPTTKYTPEEFKAAYDATLGTGRLFFFDHFGSTSIENILARCKYMRKALGCKVQFIDHISIIVSAQENGDERKAIDEIMTRLRTMVQELDIALFLVSHLRRPDGKGHEEGAHTSLSQLRGSAAIAQLSDAVIGLERNGQDPDPIIANTTTVRVLKNRFSGELGEACHLHFDKATGRMNEVDAPSPAMEEEAL